LRGVVQKRKERAQIEREHEAAEQAAAAERVKKEKDESGKSKKTGQKRSREDVEADVVVKKESVPAAGAHRLARQDGVGVHEGMLFPGASGSAAMCITM